MIHIMDNYCQFCGVMINQGELYNRSEVCPDCNMLSNLIIYTMKAESSQVGQVPKYEVMNVLHKIATYYDTDIKNASVMLEDSSEHDPVSVNDDIYWMVGE